ncbi:SAM binding motif containing protein [Coccidioides immitis RMSCC 3703]|uniref:SAM binding motif containing protein n=1 Tax=Coccidioides immitis RMSCC 3703 TaxID=454286 RepID=A0A0J8QU49_COCIT|nr:SAM binding motif containing protein [Coccidioides immitis RMSCC 3703]
MAGPAGLSYLYIPPTSFASDSKQHEYYNLSSMTIASSSSTSSSSTDYTTYPLISHNGRTYLRDPDNPYPLPCDLAEIHRQSLRSLMLMHVFGAPFCSPHFNEDPPKRVLEIACGSALWSNACHEYFAKRGHSNISFTGIDIINIAPDLQKQSAVPLAEPLRVLRPGGVLEVWESDFIFRSLLPDPPAAPGLSERDQEQADATGTYTIFPATPFADAQNPYLRDYNSWAEKAFELRKLTPMPCATINLSFTSESESFQSVDSRRIAIPLGEVKWEHTSNGGTTPRKHLTEDQLTLRHTALLNVVQMIESMEPILMEASEKGKAEWDRWWAGMTQDLLQKDGVASGECLEVGAWWGQKR